MSVPQLRFQEFSETWQENSLSEVAEIKTGPFGSSLHQEDYVETGTPIITVEHLGEQGVVHRNLPLVSTEDKVRLKSYILNQGDIVFSRVGSVDRSCLISSDENGWLFSGRLLRLRLTNKNYSANFLNQNFKNEKVKYRIRSVAVGQTMASLNTEILKCFELFFPSSLEEQSKIANFLTTVDEKISHLTRKYDLITQYKKGVMQQIFSQELRFKDENGQDFAEWDEREIKDIAEVNPKSTLLPNEFIYVDLESVEKGILLKETVIAKEGAPSRAQRQLQVNDVLYQMVRPYQGNNLLFQKTGSYVASTGYAQLRSSENPVYLYYFLHLESFTAEVMNRCTGTSYPAINSTDFSTMPILVPVLAEQTKIANFLTAIDDKITITKTQREAVKQYKQGLLQQMFV